MGFLRPKSPPPPPPLPEAPPPLPEEPTPPKVEDVDVPTDTPIGEDDALMATGTKKKGRSSTILTSSVGLTQPATVRRKALLG